MNKYCPEIVAAATAFSSDVTYIPVSALGCSPTLQGTQLVVDPEKIEPWWAEVPMLYAMQRTIPRLIPTIQSKKTRAVPK